MGLIPACAGKTEQGEGGLTAVPAHPRVCGENSMDPWQNQLGQGSSPRVRGKRQSRYLPYHQLGLIPACAGKTSFLSVKPRAIVAHPRVCGENSR